MRLYLLLAGLAVIEWALSVLVRDDLEMEQSLSLQAYLVVAYAVLGLGAILVLDAGVSEQLSRLRLVPPGVMVAATAGVALAACLGHFLRQERARETSVSYATKKAAIDTAIGVAAAYIFASQPLTPLRILGAILIAAGLWLLR